MVIASPAATWPLAIVIQPRSASATEPTSPQADAEAVGTSATPITLAQFQQAAQIAKLAAEHGMHELSQRAMRESLAKRQAEAKLVGAEQFENEQHEEEKKQ